MAPRRRRPPRPGALSDLPPLRIARAIILLQASYYVTALILILFTTLTLGQPFNISLLLDWKRIRGDTTLGWVVGFCFVLTGFITIIPTLLLTRHLPSTLIPDFALTLHFFHLLTTSFYTRALPTNLLWWILQATSAGLMVLGGVWGVRWREVQTLRGFGRKANEAVTGSGTGTRTEQSGVQGGGGIEMVAQGGGGTRRADDNV